MAYDETDYNSQEFKQKLSKYEEAQRNGSTIYMDSDDLTDIAEYYYKNGNIGQAVDAIDYAVRLFPNCTMPLIFRSRIALLDEKDTKSAKAYAEKVGDKSELDYLYLQAEIMIVENQPDEADKYLHEQMEKIDDDDVPDYVLDVAMIFADYNLYELAEQWLDLSDEPELADYKEIKGRIASWRGNYDESEHIFEQLVDEDPYSAHFWNNLASTQFQQNRIKDSIASSEFSIAINPQDDEALLNKANGLFSLCHFEEALDYYERYTKLRPMESAGYIYQGNTLLDMCRFHAAVDMYKKAEALTQDSPSDLFEIYQDLAYALAMTEDIEQAIEYVDKAESLHMGDRAELMVLRGHIYLEHNKVREAQKCFRKALQASKFSARVFLRIAISLFDSNYISLAYKLFKTIPALRHNQTDEGYSYMALCCKQLGKDDEYLENLKMACEKNPSEALMVLGHLFPDDLNARDFYKYEYNKLKSKQ